MFFVVLFFFPCSLACYHPCAQCCSKLDYRRDYPLGWMATKRSSGWYQRGLDGWMDGTMGQHLLDHWKLGGLFSYWCTSAFRNIWQDRTTWFRYWPHSEKWSSWLEEWILTLEEGQFFWRETFIYFPWFWNKKKKHPFFLLYAISALQCSSAIQWILWTYRFNLTSSSFALILKKNWYLAFVSLGWIFLLVIKPVEGFDTFWWSEPFACWHLWNGPCCEKFGLHNYSVVWLWTTCCNWFAMYSFQDDDDDVILGLFDLWNVATVLIGVFTPFGGTSDVLVHGMEWTGL